MKKDDNTGYDLLERIFHEPNRLAIMSTLCAADKGLSFSELKERCDLTDGNLNRHLKVLEDAKAVKIRKKFVDGRPRTTVSLSQSGMERFNEYLVALEDVLDAARKALPAGRKVTGGAVGARIVRA
jgi:DNA-binding transcriptional ArsR family regulator